MEKNQWIEQVRSILERAKGHQNAVFSDLHELRSSIDDALRMASDGRKAAPWQEKRPPYPIRRKWLLTQNRLYIKHYALTDEAQAFVYATGAEVLEQLDNDQLAALQAWLERLCERMGYPDTPLSRALSC